MSSKINVLLAAIFTITSLLLACSSEPSVTPSATAEGVMISTKIPLANSAQPTVTVSSPTFSAAEAKTEVIDFLKNNGGCHLPCIWGLMPGNTTTIERQNKLAPFGKISESDFAISRSEDFENPGGIGFSVIRDNVRSSFGLSYYENENRIEILSLVALAQQDQRMVFEDSNYLDLMQYYTLPHLLSNYGLPSDVLVAAWPHDPFLKADYDPFSIVVVYKDLGIMAEYISPNQRNDDKSSACPKQSYIILRTWDPKRNISLKKIASIAAAEGISENAYDFFKPIQDAASMSINDFYHKFKESNTTQCLEVPSDLWTP